MYSCGTVCRRGTALTIFDQPGVVAVSRPGPYRSQTSGFCLKTCVSARTRALPEAVRTSSANMR